MQQKNVSDGEQSLIMKQNNDISTNNTLINQLNPNQCQDSHKEQQQQEQYQQQTQQLKQQLKQQQKQQQHQSSSSGQDIQYDQNDNGKFFNMSQIKPLDLKSQWLGNTDHLLRKFSQKLQQISISQHQIKKGIQLFQQNQQQYLSNSLKYETIKKTFSLFDKKKIYQQFLNKSRKTLQKLDISLIMNIGSYVEDCLWYFLAKMRRVAKVFNYVYKNEEVIQFISEKDLGAKQNRKVLDKVCKQWLLFKRTFLYYKQIKYTDQIPPNSFKNDLQQSVLFLNYIYRLLFKTSNFNFTYFILINNFMIQHRIILALSTLSLTNLIMIRKASIVAFSNFLALNSLARKKEEITKTKYYQVLKVVQNEEYKDCLIINTKVANYLEEQCGGYEFSVYILYSISGRMSEVSNQFLQVCSSLSLSLSSSQQSISQQYEKNNKYFRQKQITYNILMFHKYNDLKSKFVKYVPLICENDNLILYTGSQGIKILFKVNKQKDEEQENKNRNKKIEQYQKQQYKHKQQSKQLQQTHQDQPSNLKQQHQQNIGCQFIYVSDIQYLNFQFQKGTLMNCLVRDQYQKQCQYKNISNKQTQLRFSQCYLFNQQYYYIIVIKNPLRKDYQDD